MSAPLKTLYKACVKAAVGALTARAQRTPYTHLPGYMHRYWLVKPSRWTFGIGVRLHHILRSDLDRDLHTHPWWWSSLVLHGTYWEVLPAQPGDPRAWTGGFVNINEPFHIRQRKPGHMVFRRSSTRHKLMLFRGPVWTLFIHGRDHGTWGYHVPGVGLIDRYEYEAYSKQKEREAFLKGMS